jgi:flagellar capping protein FliD
MEHRMARLEGAYEQVSDRLNSLDRRLDSMDRHLDSLERKVDSNFRWLTGMIFGSWITTISAVLFHR